MSRIVLMLAIPALLFGGADWATAATKLHNIRMGVNRENTRLVFDASGDRPTRIGPATQEGIVVEFAKLHNEVNKSKSYNHPGAAISGVSFREENGASQVLVSFRTPKTAVKQEFLPSNHGREGSYRLILDFFPGETPQNSETKGNQDAGPERNDGNASADTAPAAPAKQSDSAHPKDSSSAEIRKPQVLTTASNQTGAAKKQGDKGTPPKNTPPVQHDQEPTQLDPEKAATLYDQADSYFDAHQQDLLQNAPQILELYLGALKASPKSPRSAAAFYRCGLVYVAIGNLKKAEKYLQQVISAGPDHPLYAKCWLKLGEVYHRQESYVEAIEAFRFALRSRLERGEKLEAQYYLGRDLNLVGANKEALEILQQCLNDDPTFYVKKPDVIKFLGESHFALKQLDTSKESLLRYLNIAQDAPDRDLVLAKVAEIFLGQGDQTLANKVYTFIQHHYQDSEGDIISRIRNAEMMEKREHGNQEGPAIAIYRELAKKNLSLPLRRLVYFKLASWESKHGNYPRSMELIDEILRDKRDVTSHEEFTGLRDKVLKDWATKSASEKDHIQVIQLYEQYGRAFRNPQPGDLECLIADAYASLGLYSNAIEVYERLLSNSRKRNEEWLLKIALYNFLLGETDKAVHICSQIQSTSCELKKTELLGRICTQQKKHGEAVKYFAKVFQKDKDISSAELGALLAYAESLIGMTKYEEALQLLTKAQEQAGRESGEKKLPLFLLSSICHQELKQPQKAIEAMEAALALVSSEEQKSQLSYELSKLYLAAGQRDKASQRLSQLIGGSQSFWKTAAQQQLDSIKMAMPK